jgi:hypothetical protein
MLFLCPDEQERMVEVVGLSQREGQDEPQGLFNALMHHSVTYYICGLVLGFCLVGVAGTAEVCRQKVWRDDDDDEAAGGGQNDTEAARARRRYRANGPSYWNYYFFSGPSGNDAGCLCCCRAGHHHHHHRRPSTGGGGSSSNSSCCNGADSCDGCGNCNSGDCSNCDCKGSNCNVRVAFAPVVCTPSSHNCFFGRTLYALQHCKFR